MNGLSKKDREIVRQLSQGVPDLAICRQFGLLPAQLDAVLNRVAKRAATYEVEEDAAAMYERALRLRAENTYRSLEARFNALMDASPNAILVVNAMTGAIRQVNENAAKLFGYSVGSLVGRSVEDLVAPKLRGVHPAYRIGFLTSARKREMGYHPPIFAHRSDGTEFEVAIALTATSNDEDVMVVCTEFARWTAVGDAVMRESDRTP